LREEILSWRRICKLLQKVTMLAILFRNLWGADPGAFKTSARFGPAEASRAPALGRPFREFAPHQEIGGCKPTTAVKSR
jgi:hypothetical protein